MKTVRKMSKRIRKKKLRMQLIKALEKMENGDGIVLVWNDSCVNKETARTIYPMKKLWKRYARKCLEKKRKTKKRAT